MMRTARFLLLFSACLALATETGWSQRASTWRSYRIGDGLPEAACASVTISPRGRVLVQHLNASAISELDGYTVRSISAPVSARTRVHEAMSGQLWTIVQEGLMEYQSQDQRWVLHPVPDMLQHFRGDASQDVPFFAVRQGRVIFLLPDRLMEFNAEDPHSPRLEVLLRASQTLLERFHSLTVTRGGDLWIAGSRGLAHVRSIRSYRSGDPWSEFILPSALEVRSLQEPFEDDSGGVTCVAEGTGAVLQKWIVHFDGRRWTTIPAGDRRLRRAWRGPGQVFWAITIDGLFQQDAEGNLVENHELSARQFLDVAVEPGGTFWLATSDGLFHHIMPPWRPAPGPETISGPIHDMSEDTAGRLWLVAGAELCVIDGDRTRRYPMPSALGRGPQPIRSLMAMRNGTILLAGNGNLMGYQTATETFTPLSSARSGERLQLVGGMRNGDAFVVGSRRTGGGLRHTLYITDGLEMNPFAAAPASVSTNRVLAMHAPSNGDLWLSTERGLLWQHEGEWTAFPYRDPGGPTNITSFVELSDGRVWGASASQIWEMDGRRWTGVRGAFDGLNGIIRARDGSIWAASETGLTRFVNNTWIDHGTAEGLPGATVRSILEDQRGRLWAGTTHGAAVFPSPSMDPTVDQHPPKTAIERSGGGEVTVPEKGTLVVTFQGTDKWRQTPRDRLMYSYRLNERDWSSFSELGTVALTDLPPGKHYLAVRAMDRNANIEVSPSLMTFSVALPWYKETRLVLIALMGIAGVLFFAAVAFNRHRQLLLSYAEIEKKVADRTRQLAQANAQLAHSQKMTALGTLAAGIAHDFNNILSIIKGSAQIIEDNVHDPQKVVTRVDRIKTVVEQGSGIVRAMLGFSRGPAHQPASCDVNIVVEDTIKLLGDRFVREVEIRFNPGEGIPEVAAPRDFIQQILLNFIFNAAEAMSQNKHIEVFTGLQDRLRSDLVLTPASASAYVTVSVKDFGTGISPDNLPRIFEPFFTTKSMSARRGTGLGLSMVYELARKMEAGLAVDSAVDRGSTFTLILPVGAVSTVSGENTPAL